VNWDEIFRVCCRLLLTAFLSVATILTPSESEYSTTALPSPPILEDAGAPSNVPSPTPTRVLKPKPTPTPRPISRWKTSEVSWYGPGFYGHGTACGQKYTKTIIGVAHKTLRCGTLVEFSWRGRTAIARVIDRGPYVTGRDWDLSAGLCRALDHCFTGSIKWRLVKAGGG
jgi:rare lipoprotein A (peptidoglycan hydrolase)